MNRITRFTLIAAGLAVASPLHALQHFMKVRELYVGPPDNADAQYINLQMFMPFQNFVNGYSVKVYDATDMIVGTYTFELPVANFTDQSYILIATPAAEERFGVSADLQMTPDVLPAGGKACFEDFDCVSWGEYLGDTENPDATGEPHSPELGLPPDTALRRDISRGDPERLDEADDTGSSAEDFAIAEQPRPTNNLGMSGTPPDGGDRVSAPARAGPAAGGGSGGLSPAWLLAVAALGGRRRSRRSVRRSVGPPV